MYTVAAGLMDRKKEREHERSLKEADIKLEKCKAETLRLQYSPAVMDLEKQKMEIEAQRHREHQAHQERLMSMYIRYEELRLQNPQAGMSCPPPLMLSPGLSSAPGPSLLPPPPMLPSAPGLLPPAPMLPPSLLSAPSQCVDNSEAGFGTMMVEAGNHARDYGPGDINASDNADASGYD